jgi:hypothetical protein
LLRNVDISKKSHKTHQHQAITGLTLDDALPQSSLRSSDNKPETCSPMARRTRSCARILRALSRALVALCLPVLFGFTPDLVVTEDDHNTKKRAQVAARTGDLTDTDLAREQGSSDQPDDYAPTLRLAWQLFVQERYADAERAYRLASENSRDAPLAQLGLSWSLVRQQRCDEAREVFRALDATFDTVGDTAPLTAAIVECERAARVHGSLWSGLGGALYNQHPWKRRSADLTVGAALALRSAWFVGAAYRGLRLGARDARVASIDQHEGYLQAGYASARFGLSVHGALLFAGYSTLGRSEHVAVAGRWTRFGDVLLELAASIYPDLFVARVAPSWVLSLGRYRLTPGLSIEHFSGETLLSGSLNLSIEVAHVWLIAGGKVGPEYRAAYLSSQAVFNSEDRSEWSAWLSARADVSTYLGLFVNFMVIQLASPDRIISRAELLGLGASCHF